MSTKQEIVDALTVLDITPKTLQAVIDLEAPEKTFGEIDGMYWLVLSAMYVQMRKTAMAEEEKKPLRDAMDLLASVTLREALELAPKTQRKQKTKKPKKKDGDGFINDTFTPAFGDKAGSDLLRPWWDELHK